MSDRQRKVTLQELREVIAWLDSETDEAGNSLRHPYQIGEAYFIRTVTFHYTGKLVAVWPKELVLEEAAWIADDGRFADALESGEFNEVEPYPMKARVIINRDVIVDAIVWKKPLPRKQK
jgi:hypothetical protein